MSEPISILIPTYNYNVFPLVEIAHQQAEALGNSFEIMVYDDCSPNPTAENEQINTLAHARYVKLPKNIGRSAIRNLLAKDAKNELLLFLDADTMINHDDFLKRYLDALSDTSEIIYGGIKYQDEKPETDQMLRWIYGIKREALPVSERQKQPHLRFLTLNFLIKKTVFSKIKFNEEIPNLRHEDTLFALDAKKAKVNVAHIDNTVIHNGLESSEVFLRKSVEAVDALLLLVKDGLINPNDTRLSSKGEQWQGKLMGQAIKGVYKAKKKAWQRNLLSAKPSMKIFDLYRLGYYLTKRNS